MNALPQTIDGIPWRRLTTAYGRGTDIPRLIQTGQFRELADLIEHQSTLWQVTPWVLLILLRELPKREPDKVTSEEINLYLAVASSITADYYEAGPPAGTMNELLDEQYLWPENEEEDELLWEEEEPPSYEPQPFFSYYYYSHSLLKEAEPVFLSIMNDSGRLAPAIQELLLLLRGEK
ncbi:hypothetical protein LJK88_45480 [Paenibacillus sp. P26]|nr:hypothetical protein LJK88_45480 [Paenibacillus sp. P26]UUZ92107.1 hypothetical protein LJK87_42875 [Paenibacillus sp. P25]